MYRPEEKAMRKITLISKQLYAEKHNYRLLELDWEAVTQHAEFAACPLCAKILAMLEILPQLEWMVWMDGDVLINNPDRCLSDLLDSRFAIQIPANLGVPPSAGKSAQSLYDIVLTVHFFPVDADCVGQNHLRVSARPNTCILYCIFVLDVCLYYTFISIKFAFSLLPYPLFF